MNKDYYIYSQRFIKTQYQPEKCAYSECTALGMVVRTMILIPFCLKKTGASARH